MSMTHSVGCMPLAHYNFMASCLEKAFRTIAEARCIHIGDMGPPLFADAKEFFDKLMDEQRKIPQNPPAALKAYSHFVNVLRALYRRKREDFNLNTEQIRAKAKAYKEFFLLARKPRKLSPDEIILATEMADFMKVFHDMAESDNYGRHMDASHVHMDRLAGRVTTATENDDTDDD
jgi:hypothetical protein